MVGTEWFESDSWPSAFLSVILPVLSFVGFLFVRCQVRTAPDFGGRPILLGSADRGPRQ
jgi:hypothetical protein